MENKFYIPRERYIVIVIVLICMWLGLMLFFYLKADEVTKDPCSICANRVGENIICTTSGLQPITRIYYPNFSITEKVDNVRQNNLLQP